MNDRKFKVKFALGCFTYLVIVSVIFGWLLMEPLKWIAVKAIEFMR